MTKKYIILSLILINFITPTLVILEDISNPQNQWFSQAGWLAFAALGSVLNLIVCTWLGEEMYDEGFKALLWAIAFSYIVFLILTVRYLFLITGIMKIRNKYLNKRLIYCSTNVSAHTFRE